MSFVYFLRPIGKDGPVKIGCSRAPLSRLETYLPWSCYPLEVAATLPGDDKLEWRFHAMFEQQRTHHEWFTASPELSAVIEAVQAGVFNVDVLPAPRRLTHAPRSNGWSERARIAVSWGHRIRHLAKRGVTVPAEVRGAQWRYNCGRYANATPGLEADREIVERFLADHPRLADKPKVGA